MRLGASTPRPEWSRVGDLVLVVHRGGESVDSHLVPLIRTAAHSHCSTEPAAFPQEFSLFLLCHPHSLLFTLCHPPNSLPFSLPANAARSPILPDQSSHFPLILLSASPPPPFPYFLPSWRGILMQTHTECFLGCSDRLHCQEETGLSHPSSQCRVHKKDGGRFLLGVCGARRGRLSVSRLHRGGGWITEGWSVAAL